MSYWKKGCLIIATAAVLVSANAPCEARGGFGAGAALGVGVGLGLGALAIESYHAPYRTWHRYDVPPAPYVYEYPYPGPALIIQQDPATILPPAPRYRYYCPDQDGYYPYVRTCPAGWLKVVPPAEPSVPEDYR